MGSGRTPEGLLTVRDVARRLSMSVGWVYRRIDKGDLQGVRRAPDGPLLVTAEALADYLTRFPGIEAPATPAAAVPKAGPLVGTQKIPSASRKGAA